MRISRNSSKTEVCTSFVFEFFERSSFPRRQFEWCIVVERCFDVAEMYKEEQQVGQGVHGVGLLDS